VLPLLLLLLLLVRSGYMGLTVRHQLMVLLERSCVISSTSTNCDCTKSDMTAGNWLSVIVTDESILTGTRSSPYMHHHHHHHTEV